MKTKLSSRNLLVLILLVFNVQASQKAQHSELPKLFRVYYLTSSIYTLLLENNSNSENFTKEFLEQNNSKNSIYVDGDCTIKNLEKFLKIEKEEDIVILTGAGGRGFFFSKSVYSNKNQTVSELDSFFVSPISYTTSNVSYIQSIYTNKGILSLKQYKKESQDSLKNRPIAKVKSVQLKKLFGSFFWPIVLVIGTFFVVVINFPRIKEKGLA